jgi:hypothetical protein
MKKQDQRTVAVGRVAGLEDVEVEGGGGDGSTGDIRGKGEGCHYYLDITLLWVLMERSIICLPCNS